MVTISFMKEYRNAVCEMYNSSEKFYPCHNIHFNYLTHLKSYFTARSMRITSKQASKRLKYTNWSVYAPQKPLYRAEFLR